MAAPSSRAQGARASGDRGRERIAEIGVALAAAIWAANFVAVKAGIADLGPLLFSALRYVVAAAALLALVRLRRGTIRLAPGLAVRLLALGLFGFGAYQVVWTFGLERIPAGDSALILAAAPILTGLLAAATGSDRLTAPKAVGTLLAFLGVALVVGGGAVRAASLEGDLLTLAAAAIWAVYTVAGTRLLGRVEPLEATAWSVLGGSLLVLPLGAWELATGARAPVATPGAFAAVLYSGILAAAVANVLTFEAIRHVGPTRASLAQFLVPAGGVALGALALGEAVRPGQVAGGIVILAGLALARRRGLVPERLDPRRRRIAAGPGAPPPDRGP